MLDRVRGDGQVKTLSETTIIDEIFLKHSPPGKRVLLGPGDDSAVISDPGGRLAITKDMLIEGVHFSFNYCTPQQIGEKAIHVNVSDLAAMGARPMYALIGVGIPPEMDVQLLKAFSRGLNRALRRYDMGLLGGDTVRSEKLVISVTAIGFMKGNALGRKGAREGDMIYSSGVPGLSYLGLLMLRSGKGNRVRGTGKKAVERHLRPWIDIALATFIHERGIATAMIDTSDGLVTDLGRMLKASRVGAVIDEKSLPAGRVLPGLAERVGEDWLQLSLFGGEDYNLLFTVPPEKMPLLKRWKGRSPLFCLGRVTRERGLFLKGKTGMRVIESDVNPLFEHFSREDF